MGNLSLGPRTFAKFQANRVFSALLAGSNEHRSVRNSHQLFNRLFSSSIELCGEA
jgi:hypothetical protein